MQIERRASATVLVVDDDGDMRWLAAGLSRRDGHRVIEAEDGAQAIVVVESAAIDIAILDQEMPGMNGLDVLSFLQTRRPELPVIFITAFGGWEVAEESRRCGALHYVEKPFRVGSLVEAVHALIHEGPSGHHAP